MKLKKKYYLAFLPLLPNKKTNVMQIEIKPSKIIPAIKWLESCE